MAQTVASATYIENNFFAIQICRLVICSACGGAMDLGPV
jgi:hypothetical protein